MTDVHLPKDFLWGFATASYQIEGAVNDDGRGPSIWDTFCQQPGKIADGTNGDVACDSYHRTAEDIALLRQYGAKAYRFSLAWPRIIPLGGRTDPINPAGLAYYSRLIDDLLAAGIEPLVTLYHWDLPATLHARYGGPLHGAEFVADFTRYARVCFAALGDRVKYWITFNEPWCTAVLGYGTGFFAPGRTSDRAKSPEGDAATEPWIVGHNQLLAHAAAVEAYRADFQPTQGGKIGITLNGDWPEPYNPASPADHAACARALDFTIGWFADPIYLGTYPASMRAQLGPRLPHFTPTDAARLRGSADFYGMNHYAAHYIRARPSTEPPDPTDTAGHLDILPQNHAGEWIGPATQSEWLRPCAPAFRKMLGWIHRRYGAPEIVVTENGTSVLGEDERGLPGVLEDGFRVRYFADYVRAMAEAVTWDGVRVRGYLGWSLLDNFEWADGYRTRFGVTYVDYKDGLRRYPKRSGLAMRGLFEGLMEGGPEGERKEEGKEGKKEKEEGEKEGEREGEKEE